MIIPVTQYNSACVLPVDGQSVNIWPMGMAVDHLLDLKLSHDMNNLTGGNVHNAQAFGLVGLAAAAAHFFTDTLAVTQGKAEKQPLDKAVMYLFTVSLIAFIQGTMKIRLPTFRFRPIRNN